MSGVPVSSSSPVVTSGPDRPLLKASTTFFRSPVGVGPTASSTFAMALWLDVSAKFEKVEPALGVTMSCSSVAVVAMPGGEELARLRAVEPAQQGLARYAFDDDLAGLAVSVADLRGR